jgi:hypothetical protein
MVVDVKASAGSDTLMVKVLVADLAGLLLSVTWTVKVNVPVAVGVPDKIPLVPSATPGGRVPDA